MLTDTHSHSMQMGFHTCAPNEVMVISGAGYVRPQLVSGGRVWVWGWQKLQR